MAQAARLSLRMHKELKLLLTDPPPGASFPLLSADSDLCSAVSFSAIDAQIEGPEGTVYAKGIFKIKIRIPERYPFQPPIVTFATPIYHPNIDTGGRICLDILNLPPKGAWQPSLNISTVLTSIGLLLSEPNPEDGLMCEASREYKYNRQAFDQKARSMTEKYARSGVSGHDTTSECFQAQSDERMMETKGSDPMKTELDECSLSQRKPYGMNQKLSLESSWLFREKEPEERVSGAPIHHLGHNRKEDKRPEEESKPSLDEYFQNHENRRWTKRKLSLESLGPPETRYDAEENLVSTHHTSLFNSPVIVMTSTECSRVPPDSHHNEKQPRHDGDSKSINDTVNSSSSSSWNGQNLSLKSGKSIQTSDNIKVKLHSMPQLFTSQSNATVSNGTFLQPTTSHTQERPKRDWTHRTGAEFNNTAKCKKQGLTGKKLSCGLLGASQGQENDKKENVAPTPNSLSSESTMLLLNPQVGEHYGYVANDCSTKVSKNNGGIADKFPPYSPGYLLGSNNCTVYPNLDSLPALNDCKIDANQQLMRYDDEKFAGVIKEQEAGSPLSEAVIVLDSDDSEEESGGCLRSRLLLGRKRLPGKWKA
ncbi:uncharacterized protein LOC127813555 [Diospyros lotus]|uniref:uncharacterized protein LOC127813555 n=1 Tax=Diospyros lotus TaxID=55363 RepID=UPI002258D1B1|nr:uncharacterized protein LOC127813555 [Diospyros lotus]